MQNLYQLFFQKSNTKLLMTDSQLIEYQLVYINNPKKIYKRINVNQLRNLFKSKILQQVQYQQNFHEVQNPIQKIMIIKLVMRLCFYLFDIIQKLFIFYTENLFYIKQFNNQINKDIMDYYFCSQTQNQFDLFAFDDVSCGDRLENFQNNLSHFASDTQFNTILPQVGFQEKFRENTEIKVMIEDLKNQIQKCSKIQNNISVKTNLYNLTILKNQNQSQQNQARNSSALQPKSKKNLTKNWIKRIGQIIKQDPDFLKFADQINRNELLSKLKQGSYTISLLTNIIQQYPYIKQVFQTKYFTNQYLEKYIFNLKRMSPLTKLEMIQSIESLKFCFHHPQNFFTWKHQNNLEDRNCTDISEKCQNLQLKEIIEKLDLKTESNILFESKKNKSDANNLSYYWAQKIKGFLNEIRRTNKNPQIISQFDQIKQSFKSKCTKIELIREIMRKDWFREYVIINKIQNNVLVQQILNDKSINLIKKKKMIQSYCNFVEGLKHPDQFKRWAY